MDLYFVLNRVIDRYYLKKGCVFIMTVCIKVPKSAQIPGREMTLEAMELDFTYRIAQKLSKTILDEDLISLEEFEKLTIINEKTFYPFMDGILR